MQIEFITKADLADLKNDILQEMKSLFNPSVQPPKKWLKSNEVKNLLGCSHGTLQNLRIKGTISPVKIGGVWYYSSAKIYELLEKGI